jgi:hypothetical protein
LIFAIRAVRMAAVADHREVRPELARDVTEFIDLLRGLKDEAGLSYRQLEERAARRGEVLARSTIADALRRRALPRPEVLAAFVRACGVRDGEVQRWLDTRERLAAAPPDPPDQPDPSASPDPGESAPATRCDGRCRARLLAAAGVALVLLTLGAWALWPLGGSDEAQDTREPFVYFKDDWVEIRPARTPELCLTEGRERTGRYEDAVAVQRPCAEAVPPRTYLRSAGDGFYHIEWHHPRHGVGCLTMLNAGPAAGMLEPWDDCSRGRPTQRFRLEFADSPPDESYRIHPESSGQCLALNDDETASGAEAVQRPCAEGDASQRFLIVPTGR